MSQNEWVFFLCLILTILYIMLKIEFSQIKSQSLIFQLLPILSTSEKCLFSLSYVLRVSKTKTSFDVCRRIRRWRRPDSLDSWRCVCSCQTRISVWEEKFYAMPSPRINNVDSFRSTKDCFTLCINVILSRRLVASSTFTTPRSPAVSRREKHVISLWTIAPFFALRLMAMLIFSDYHWIGTTCLITW